MALLTGVAQAGSGSAPQGETAAPGVDFLGALLAAAPVAPVDPAAESPLPVTPGADAAPADNAAAAELAALLATLLPVAAADAAPAPAPTSAESTEGMQTGTAVAAATTSAARALEQLLQRLAKEAGGTTREGGGGQEQGRAPALTATSIASAAATTGAQVSATTQPPADGLQQLLRAMAPRTATMEPQPTVSKPGNARAAASQAFALPQAAADAEDAGDAALRAPAPAIRPVVDAQPAQFTLPVAETPVTAPASAQSPSPAQVQPQAAALAQTPQPQQATPAATHTVRTPVGAPRWADELGSRMMLMTVSGHHEGSLSLTPEHLGPLEVRLSLSQGTTNVWFGAQHADTRAALTEALPRLRELFADAGLVLGHAGVSQEAPRQETRSGEGQPLARENPASTLDDAADAAPVARRVALGLVDTYA